MAGAAAVEARRRRESCASRPSLMALSATIQRGKMGRHEWKARRLLTREKWGVERIPVTFGPRPWRLTRTLPSVTSLRQGGRSRDRHGPENWRVHRTELSASAEVVRRAVSQACSHTSACNAA